MPVVATGPYNVAGEVTLRARAIVNDMTIDAAGDTLSDSQPYTFVLLQSAYEELQDKLADADVATTIEEEVILSIPASASSDPTLQVELSFSGFFDGVNSYATPALPADLLEPVRLWERQTGSNDRFIPMFGRSDGLPSTSGQSFHRRWDWRGDSLFLPASTLSTDIRMRYLANAPAIVDATSPVMVLRSTEPLAYLLAARFAEARGAGPAAQSFKVTAQAAIDRMINRTIKRKQRETVRRRPYRAGRS